MTRPYTFRSNIKPYWLCNRRHWLKNWCFARSFDDFSGDWYTSLVLYIDGFYLINTLISLISKLTISSWRNREIFISQILDNWNKINRDRQTLRLPWIVVCLISGSQPMEKQQYKGSTEASNWICSDRKTCTKDDFISSTLLHSQLQEPPLPLDCRASVLVYLRRDKASRNGGLCQSTFGSGRTESRVERNSWHLCDIR